VRSGRKETYEFGKDTGRYWEAGASNVHWLICTDNQVEEGIKQALAKVKSPGVFVEGNSFTEFVNPDHFVMVRQAGSDKIKSSARRMMGKATAIYVSDTTGELPIPVATIPTFAPSDLALFIEYLRSSVEAHSASSEFKL
jgi:hypothetical protein